MKKVSTIMFDKLFYRGQHFKYFTNKIDLDPLSGFYKKSITQRQQLIKKVSPDVDTELLNHGGLELSRADSMVENCIGKISLPVGLGLNFLINDKKYQVPMAVEEPSIIAATSSVAKLIGQNGGFIASSESALMTTQIHITNTSTSKMVEWLQEKGNDILKISNTFCERMVKRGGGVLGMKVRILKESSMQEIANIEELIKSKINLINNELKEIKELSSNNLNSINLNNLNNISNDLNNADSKNKNSRKENADGIVTLDLIVNTCECMGANILNTIAEGVGGYIEKFLQTPNPKPFQVEKQFNESLNNNKLSENKEEDNDNNCNTDKLKGKVLMKILSNLNVLRKTKVEFKVPIESMCYNNLSGHEVATRIVQAQEIADLDPFRAATHNKGIMNGIDAVALALGQDWRAIEAGCHSYASIEDQNENKFDDYTSPLIKNDNKYKPFTKYSIEGDFFKGSIEVPMSVGVVGGAISSNPNYQNFYKLLGKPSAQDLASIMVSVGLSNNLAALRALVCTGIQKGHMGLHAKNIAIRVGIPDKHIAEAVEYMKNSNEIRENKAIEFLEILKKRENLIINSINKESNV